ncbi:hypothetical protein ACCUM_0359 [Candidatus Accumulibacter phosphatis]|uniref:Uncharacterized protein n=1 Tax=Candidatus Accumulibacter phosphatis TaxID=327160 RepID=A0A5S4EKK2_9PROT|nr:hypothetical protein ACCUM_0359 [Candidatus Accumulibacter phosphatis]
MNRSATVDASGTTGAHGRPGGPAQLAKAEQMTFHGAVIFR